MAPPRPAPFGARYRAFPGQGHRALLGRARVCCGGAPHRLQGRGVNWRRRSMAADEGARSRRRVAVPAGSDRRGDHRMASAGLGGRTRANAGADLSDEPNLMDAGTQRAHLLLLLLTFNSRSLVALLLQADKLLWHKRFNKGCVASTKVQKHSGLHVQPHEAIVGVNTFAHKSGIHQLNLIRSCGGMDRMLKYK